MKNTDILNRINALLSRNVKLEQMTLENGTVIEADTFAVGEMIYAVDGDNKVPLEVGSYIMADGMTLEVYEIGTIGEISSKEVAEVEMKEEVAEVVEVAEEVVLAEEPVTMAQVKEVMAEVQTQIDELKSKIEEMKEYQKQAEELKAELSKIPAYKPLKHKPSENKQLLSKLNNPVNTSSTEAMIFARLSN
jgi:myosin heavy subunit